MTDGRKDGWDAVSSEQGDAVLGRRSYRRLTVLELQAANSGQRPDLLRYGMVYHLEPNGGLWIVDSGQIVRAPDQATRQRLLSERSQVFLDHTSGNITDANGTQLFLIGGGGSYPEYANFAALPGGAATGDTAIVLAPSGIPFINRRDSGLYRYNGSAWVFLGSVPEGYFLDNVLQFMDATDPTKVVKFEIDQVAPATIRTVSMPDKSGTLAMTSDITDHEAAGDPHVQYLLTAEGAALVTAHSGAVDPTATAHSPRPK